MKERICIDKGKNCHCPRLDTVLMVEEVIKKESPISKTKLFRTLPKQVMWGTLEIILKYLGSRNMIARDKKGQIVWIYNPKLVEKYMKKENLEIKL